MVKTYLKYEVKDVIGQISGKACKIETSPDGKFIYSGSNEYVLVINSKTGLVVHKIFDSQSNSKSIVTCVNIDESNSYLAVGYNTGLIVVYDAKSDYVQTKRFSLHKSAITSLQFNKNVNILASGSKDTNIFLWDIIGETVLYKLSGHKDSITKIMFYNVQLENYDEMEILISSSKDNTIKIWNIKNQETLQTIADLVHKVTDFLIYENILILGSFDQKLRLYQFHKKDFVSNSKDNNYFAMKGYFNRQSSAKILTISLSSDNKIISILSNDNSVEFIKILSEGELKRRLVKIELDKETKNEKREKLIAKEKYNEINEKCKILIQKDEYNYKFLFYSLFKFIGEQKISSQVFLKNSSIIMNSKNIWKFCIGLGNNSIEIYELSTNLIEQNIFIKNNFSIEEKTTDEESLSVQKSFAIDNYGHREILRFVKISEKDNLFLTTSNDSIRLWNYSTMNVVKALNLKNIICGEFILDDKYIILGSKQGTLYLINTLSFAIEQEIEKAHLGEIWNLNVIKYSYMDKRYKIVTCSSDKSLKYWNINRNILLKDEKLITEFKAITAMDQITFCMVSPDGRYLIYSMLDNSIRIFYEDTNKFFLNLYGHKLPVLSFDVSSDGALLISGSADKNVKLWGMDFGDCHKSFFAHQDSVTVVKFVKKTHYFFSGSKDKVIRYWDADTYDLIMEFSDFFGDIWSLDINSLGTSMIAVSADFSIRVYEITKEQVLPDWEQERKLDKTIEEEFQKELDQKNVSVNAINKEIDQIVPIKKSMDNISFAEDMMDALDVAEKFKNEVYQYEIAVEEFDKSQEMIRTNNVKKIRVYNLEQPEVPKASPFLLGKNIFDYVLFKLKSIRNSELENTLNNLPYSYVQTLMFYLEYYVRNNIDIELNTRCVLFLITLFESQLSNDKTQIRLLNSIRQHLKKNLTLAKEILSFNIQAVDFVIRSHEIKEKSIEDFKNSYKLDNLI